MNKLTKDLINQLENILIWIDNWNPNFEHDLEWQEERKEINELLIRAKKETQKQ